MDFFKHHILWVVAFVLAVCIVIGYEYVFAAPADFSTGSIVRIARGDSVPEIAKNLTDERVIAYPILLRAILRLSGKSDSIQSGIYQFKKPQNVFAIARQIIVGEYGMPPVRITLTEGMTVRDMAMRVTEAFPDIRADEFRSLAESEEGYLFPDTYFFQPSAETASIIAVMRSNFDAKIAPLMSDIQASGHSLSDIIIMASIIEKEARTSDVRRTVAGILWNRLSLGMPLQVDAVFGYIFNRDTYSPSYADLKVDSPYNTYTHAGLPPGPINNPGLDALEAVLHPKKTNYLYYLTDKSGVMHYATTFAGHQANQNKYLR